MSAINHDKLRRTADCEDEITAAYDRLKNIHHVARQTGFSVEAIRKFLIKKGLHQPRSIRRVSKQAEAQIVEAYRSGVEVDEIAVSHDMQDAIGVIYEVLRRNGVSPNRLARYSANLRAFARPSGGCYTPSQKYWAGMLLADGCVLRNKGTSTLVMNLQESDREHIEKFKRFLQSNHRTYRTPPKPAWKGQSKEQYGLTISGLYWIEDLAPLGVHPRKTATAIVPPEFLFDRDYWRGVIDGDGWISIYKKRDRTHFLIGVCGTPSVCQAFGEAARSIAPDVGLRFRVNCKDRSSSYQELTVRGLSAYQVIQWLYLDASTYLDRKHEKAMEVCRLALSNGT